MPGISSDQRPTWGWVPAVQLVVAALWVLWAVAPSSPVTPWWFDFGIVPGLIACLVGVAGVAMWKRRAPTGAFAWMGLTALGIILTLHAFFAYVIWTFPAGL